MSRPIWLTAALLLVLTGAALSAPDSKPAPDPTAAARLKLAREVFNQMLSRVAHQERFDIEDLELWSQHILESELDAAATADERRAAYQAQVERTTSLEKTAKAFARTGQGLESDGLAAEYYRLRAETQFGRAD